MSATLPEHLAALMQPAAYRHPVAEVRLVETHISWVLLTGEMAYKIKRPVCFPFLDLRSLERRAFFCKEELRLNRRFASQLYEDVCPIVVVDGAARMDGPGEPVEYAVKMCQFPRDNELDNLLAQTRIAPAELAAFGRELAAIHADWLAERLAPLLGAVHLRSDIERKRLAGLDDRARTGSALGEGIYSGDFTSRVYAYLGTAIDDILSGGYSAVVDATFSRREERDAFRKIASHLSVPSCLIHCHASHEVLRSRIVERDRQGRDASEADVKVLDWQREHWEPVATDEQWTVISVDTADVDVARLARRIDSR